MFVTMVMFVVMVMFVIMVVFLPKNAFGGVFHRVGVQGAPREEEKKKNKREKGPEPHFRSRDWNTARARLSMNAV